MSSSDGNFKNEHTSIQNSENVQISAVIPKCTLYN